MRILFAGTPEFSLPPLRGLLGGGHAVCAVLTQPDRRAGRGKQMRASPVKSLALEHDLEVLQPETLKAPGWREALTRFEADLMVVVAYGLMIPDWLLTLPRLGCWNIHASLLPRWRGAAPIQRCIEAGDEHTGVCIMQMDATLDTGPVFHCKSTAISRHDTAGTLHDRLSDMGAEALEHCLRLAETEELPPPVAQVHSRATYARKLSKAEARLDWGQPAALLLRRIRAFNPWPVAWFEHDGQRLRIWQAEPTNGDIDIPPGQMQAVGDALLVGTADRAIKINEIQRAGGRRLQAREFLKAFDIDHG